MSSAGTGPCPDETTIDAYVRGELATMEASDPSSSLRAHTDGCERCRGRVAEARRAAQTEPEQPEQGSIADTAVERPSRSSIARDAKRLHAIGRYLVIGKLGKGGMGVVYAGYDPELDRKVAIKVLTTRDLDAGRVRLLREGQAMAKLDHPNVVKVFDVGTVDDEVFIAMEYVDGGTVREWLKTPRSWRAILDVYRQAARGVAAAHAAGLIHRDVKPSNILIGKDGRVRVTDFGVVRRADAAPEREPSEVPPADTSSSSGALDSPLTHAGSLVGTPTYMAPEQLAGDPADERTDQYGLCVSLYEALYGVRPFPERSRTRDGLAPIAEPPADTKVPAWVKRIVLRGLDASPAKRFPSVDALREALDRDPVIARRRWLRRSTAALAVTGAVGGYLHLRHEGQLVCEGADRRLDGVWDAVRRDAVADAFRSSGLPFAGDALTGVTAALDTYAHDWAAMRTEACKATRVRGEQSEELMDLRIACLDRRLRDLAAQADLFAHADVKVVENAVAAAQALPALSSCADAIALKAPVPLPGAAIERMKIDGIRGRIAEARALFAAGKYREALAPATEANGAASTVDYRPVKAEALSLLAELQSRTGDAKKADATAVDAILAAEAGHADDVAAHAWTLRVWAVGYGQGHFDEAYELSKFGLAAIERAGNDPRYLAQHFGIVGNVLDMQGRYEDALASYKKALALREAALGPTHPDVATTLASMGNALFDLGKYDDALAAHRRALEIRERALGPSHPQLAQSLEGIGICYIGMGKYEEAVPQLKRGLELRVATLGPDAPEVATSLNNLGSVYVDLHRYDDALAAQQRALAIRIKVFGPEHPRVAVSINNIGDVLMAMKHLPEALEQYQRALALMEKAHGAKSARLAYPLTGIGEIYVLQQKPALAVAPLERALAMRESQQGDAGDLAHTRFVLARALWDAASGPHVATDHARALELAGKARDGLAGAGAAGREPLAEVTAWLAEHH